MGKKIYTQEDVDRYVEQARGIEQIVTRQAQEDAASLADALTEAYQEIDKLVGSGEAAVTVEEAWVPEPVDHKEFAVTIRYKHTKYADDDTNDLIYLMKELGEDEFRFVTDHFTIMGVDYNQYEE